jgi:L-ascorbate metabolism protein UlaG (beta-lactamase superfamily)
MKIANIEIEWLGHSAFKIKTANKIIYIDPFKLNNFEKADIILITHSHYDHCSLADLQKITQDNSIIVCTPDCQSTIARIELKIQLFLVEPGKEADFEDIKIKAVPSYNLNKNFHPRSENYVGYIIQFKNITIYHAGDTDNIKEMSQLSEYGKNKTFIALLPVGGTYTMTAEEAAKAASIIKPTLAIPMHYDSIVGSQADAEKFSELCKKEGIKVEILEKS